MVWSKNFKTKPNNKPKSIALKSLVNSKLNRLLNKICYPFL